MESPTSVEREFWRSPMGWRVSSASPQRIWLGLICLRSELLILDAQKRIIAVGSPGPRDPSWKGMIQETSQSLEEFRERWALEACGNNARGAGFSSHTYGVAHGMGRVVRSCGCQMWLYPD